MGFSAINRKKEYIFIVQQGNLCHTYDRLAPHKTAPRAVYSRNASFLIRLFAEILQLFIIFAAKMKDDNFNK
jgi:hypothetical protein